MMYFFFFKQKTAYEIYQCDWSSDVCSSDLKQQAYIEEQKNDTYGGKTPEETINMFIEALKQNEIGRASCRERV